MTTPFTAKELMDSGLLFEINRVFLHPLGLVMHVEMDTATGVVAEKIAIRRTEDLQGYVFEEAQFEEGRKKLEAFMESEANLVRGAARFLALGYIVQGGTHGREDD